MITSQVFRDFSHFYLDTSMKTWFYRISFIIWKRIRNSCLSTNICNSFKEFLSVTNKIHVAFLRKPFFP